MVRYHNRRLSTGPYVAGCNFRNPVESLSVFGGRTKISLSNLFAARSAIRISICPSDQACSARSTIREGIFQDLCTERSFEKYTSQDPCIPSDYPGRCAPMAFSKLNCVASIMVGIILYFRLCSTEGPVFLKPCMVIGKVGSMALLLDKMKRNLFLRMP